MTKKMQLRESARSAIKGHGALPLTRTMLAAAFIFASAPLATMPAKPSRMLIVHLQGPAARILAMFRSIGTAAGLDCQPFDTGRYVSVECRPKSTDRSLGHMLALDVPEKKSIVISAFSRNVTMPQGELDPAMDAALADFSKVLAQERSVVRVDYCAAPNFDSCGD